MVHVFIRHGERTPLLNIAGNNSKTYNCKFSTWYKGSNEKFRAFPKRMDQMSRKRRHFQRFSPYPNQSICSSYVLTSRGALQQLQQGKYFFDLYNKHLRLFSKNETVSKQIKVKTTAYSRTYQSAIAFLYGLLPLFDITALDVDSVTNVHFCASKSPRQPTCKCQNSKHLYSCVLLFLKESSKNDSFHRKAPEYISTILGSFTAVSDTADGELLGFCNNLKMICFMCNQSKCSDKTSDARTDKQLAKWNYLNAIVLKYASIEMTPVLLEVVQNMKDLIEGVGKTKIFNLYSGHDMTLSPLLYVLGIHDGKRIPFASRLVIELYEKEDVHKTDQFFLKFLYNGADKSRDVIFCRNKTVDNFCSLELFIDFATSKLLQRIGYASYTDACSGKLDTSVCESTIK